MGTYTIPPPVGGWNTRDRLGEMKDSDAVALDDWEPQEGSCQIRPGYEVFATIAGGLPVKNLYGFVSANNQQLIAHTASTFTAFDLTGTVAATRVEDPGEQPRNATHTSAGLLFSTGQEDSGSAPFTWNGTSFSSRPTTVNDTANLGLFYPIVYRSRVFYVVDKTQSIVYGGVSAIQGAFTFFDIGLTGGFKGYVCGHAIISQDAGNGPDDYYCVIFSEGTVVVYTGNDPGDAAAWTRVGVYNVSPPLREPSGKAAVVSLGGDSILLTEDGYISLAKMMTYADSDFEKIRYSEKIGDAVRQQVKVHGRYGWSVTHWARRDWLLVQTPVVDNPPVLEFYAPSVVQTFTPNKQHVYKIDRSAWWRAGYPATCWADHGGDLYFGTADGKICRVTGVTDNGGAIYPDWVTCNTHVKRADREKTWGWATPLVSSNADFLNMSVRQGLDFADPPPAYSGYSVGAPGDPWDAKLWDVAQWGKSPSMSNRRFGLSGHSYRTSLRISMGGPGLDARLHGCQMGFEIAKI